jgi:hypothetical protein
LKLNPTAVVANSGLSLGTRWKRMQFCNTLITKRIEGCILALEKRCADRRRGKRCCNEPTGPEFR